ncbi:MAG: tetratricopeptide repeat protein [Streptosporangiales bacterium]|nr:tetratricopeptide repeat protein [Streptosporangiales bacterium]
MRCGYHRDAILLYRQSAEIINEIGGPHEKAILDNNTGSIHSYRGHHPEALESYRRALRIHKHMGDRRNEADVRISIGATHDQMGQHAQALAHLNIALTIEDPYLQATALTGIATTLLHTTGPDGARLYIRQAHDIYQRLGVPEAAHTWIQLQTLDTAAS